MCPCIIQSGVEKSHLSPNANARGLRPGKCAHRNAGSRDRQETFYPKREINDHRKKDKKKREILQDAMDRGQKAVGPFLGHPDTFFLAIL